MINAYYKKAISWFERGKREEDYFIRFILFYIAFEVLLKVKELNKYKLNNSIKKEFFNNIDRKILEKLKIELDREPLQNMRYKEKIIRLENINDFENILRFVNVGRNNLFHGDKGLDIKRDKIIVNFSSKILDILLEAIQKY